MFQFILDIFYPKKCMFCGCDLKRKDEYYCRDCYLKLSFVEEPNCLICGRELVGTHSNKICNACYYHKRYIDANYPSFVYSGLMKEALLKHKFAGKMWYYKPFADFIYETIKDRVSSVDYIVYPPVNIKTFYKRGYNQSELISKALSKKIGKPYIKGCIYKTRQNEKQSLMTGDMRFKNVKGVFKVRKKFYDIIENKTILFIDDVMTTGATANECAKILKKAGALSVLSATLCITR